jgi:hypothetical protein
MKIVVIHFKKKYSLQYGTALQLTSHPLRNVFEAMMEKGQDYR